MTFPTTAQISKVTKAEQIWYSATTAAIHKSPAEVRLLEDHYIFRERAEVLRFVEWHPYLIPLLLDARAVVSYHFPDALFFLDVVSDPEEVNEEQLIIFISSKIDPDAAVQKLELLDKSWWLNNLDQARGKISINLEFE